MISGSIGDIFIRLGLRADDMTSGFAQAERSLEAFGNRLFYMGARITAGITVPLVTAGTAIAKWGLEFDKAMTESLAIMSDVGPAMRDQMEETARTVSETTKFSAKEAAEAYYDLASAGLSAAESMASLDTVANFAQAGVMDLGKAGEYLAGSVSAVGNAMMGTETKVEGMAKMADLLTAANNMALGTVEDFAKAVSNKAGAAMRMYNIEIEEGIAVLMAYANQNIRAQVAGQQFWMVTRDIQRAIRENSEAWKRLGIDVYDANGNLNQMSVILASMERAFAGLTDKQREQKLASLDLQDRSKAATLALIGMSGEIGRFKIALENVSGTMREVAAKQMEALSNQLIQLWHKFQNVATAIFMQFVPVIKEYVIPVIAALIEKLKDLEAWLSTLSTEQKAHILGWTAFAAAIGPIIGALGSFILLARAASAPLQLLIKLVSLLLGATGFAGMAKAAIGAAAGMKVAQSASQQMIAGMSAAGQAAKTGAVLTTGWSIATKNMAPAAATAASGLGLIGRALGLIKGIGWPGWILTAVTTLASLVGGWGKLYDLVVAINPLLDIFVTLIGDLFYLFGKIGSTAWDWAKNIYTYVVDMLGPLKKALEYLTGIGDEVQKRNKERSSMFRAWVDSIFGIDLPENMPEGGQIQGMIKWVSQPPTAEEAQGLVDPVTGFLKPPIPSIGPRGIGFTEFDEETEEMKQAAKRMKELMEDLSGATAIRGAQELMSVMAKLPPIQHLTKEAQKQINETLFKALQAYTALGQKAPEAMRAIYTETFKNVVLPDMLADHARDMQDELQRVIKDNIGFAEQFVEVNQRAFQEGIAGAGEIFDDWDTRFMTAYDKQVKMADKWAVEMSKKIEPLRTRIPDVWRVAAEKIKEIQEHMKKNTEELALHDYLTQVKSTTSTIAEIEAAWERYWSAHVANHHRFLTSVIKLSTELSKSFRDLARVTSGAFADVLNEIAEFFEALELSSKGMMRFIEQQEKIDKQGKVTLDNIIQMTSALFQMATAFIAVTGSGSTFKRTMGGLFTGAQLGGAVGSMIGPLGKMAGTIIGAIAGGLTGLFRGLFGVSEAEKKGRETAAGFRQGLLDGLTKGQMAEVNKAMEGHWKGNKIGAATVIAVRDAYLKLGKTEQEALDVVNRLWEAEKEGPEAVKEVIEEIQANFDRLAERTENAQIFVERLGDAFAYVNDRGRLANKTMLEMLQLAKDTGGAMAQVDQIMLAGMGRVADGLLSFLDNAESWSHRTIMTMASVAVLAVREMQEAGMSLKDILEKIGPAVTKLRDHMQSAGLEGTAAFNQLNLMVEYMADETVRKAIDAVSGLNDILIGLHNTGLLNQDDFGVLAAQVAETFENLIEQGYDSDTILRLMAPSLQTLWELMTDFGYAVDDGTMALINQGLEAGVIGEHMRDDQEQLKDIMEELVLVMKDFVEEMRIARGYTQDVADAAAEIEFPPPPNYPDPGTYPDYPDYPQDFPPYVERPQGFMDPNRYRQGDLSYPSDFTFPPIPPDWENYPPITLPPDIMFAEGAYVTGPTPAWVGEGRYNEYVMPEPMLESALAEAEEDEDDGGVTIIINNEIHTLSSADFARVVEDKLIPGVLDGIRRNRRGSKTELKNMAVKR